MNKNEARMGYFFARTSSGRITTVACWGDRIEKEEKEDVEILERIPKKVIDSACRGVKILNLERFIKTRGR